ncbi:MAG TPA: FAD-dependent oxidoreductase, partial [Paralcaligenes sp.]
RCLSATSYAHGATRNMAPCMVTGEAAGVAAALCAQAGTPCADLPIDLLQSRLLESGVYLGETITV